MEETTGSLLGTAGTFCHCKVEMGAQRNSAGPEGKKKKNLIDSAFRFSSVHKTVISKVLRHQVCRTKSGVGHSDFQHNTAHGPRVIFLVVQLKLMHVLPKAFNGILTTASVLTQKVMTNFH